jgi:twinkle protein
MGVLWGSFEVKNERLLKKMLKQFNSGPLPVGDVATLNAVADRFEELPINFMKFHGSTKLDDVSA